MENNNEPAKKRKIDWNGVIIKELRKVFKRHHMKPLKKMSTNGKEENAPWREWFDEAYHRGIHTQLPEDILTKALARYPIHPQAAQHQYSEQAYYANHTPEGYQDISPDPSQQVPYTQPATTRGDLATFFPPTYVYNVQPPAPTQAYPMVPSPDSPFNQPSPLIHPTITQPAPIIHPSPMPQPIYSPPIQYLEDPPKDKQEWQYGTNVSKAQHFLEPYNTQVPSPSSDPALFSPHDRTPSEHTVPTDPSPQECTEPHSPIPASKDSDLYKYFASNPPPIALPSLDDLPPEQRLSNPTLLSSISFAGIPATPTRIPSATRLPSLEDLPPEQRLSNPMLLSSISHTPPTLTRIPSASRLPNLEDLPLEQRLSNPKFLSSISPTPATPTRVPSAPRLAPLPSLEGIPLEQRLSNPILLSSFSPSTPARNSSASRLISSTHSWPDMEQSNEFLNELTSTALPTPTFLPPFPPFLTKEEPNQSDTAHSKRVTDPTTTNGPTSNGSQSYAHNSINGPNPVYGPNPTNGPSVPAPTKIEPILPNITADRVNAEHVHAQVVEASDIRATNISVVHMHQFSDMRLKKDIETFEGGLEIIRNLQPRTFEWKENALEIASSANPSAYLQSPSSSSHTPSLSPSQATKSITKTNTLANSNISPNIPSNLNQNTNQNLSPSSANKSPKKVNYNEAQSQYYSPASYPDPETTRSHSPTPPMIRATSVPARIHASPLAPIRASSEFRLPTRNPAHPEYPNTSPSHPGYPYYPYVEGYVEEYGDSEYEVSDDDSDDEPDKNEQKTAKGGKIIGFIAQEMQQTDSRLVHEDPRNGILAIDTVGIIACVVDAVKDLDIRTQKMAAQYAASPPIPISPTPPSPPPKGGVINLCSLEQGYLVINERALNFIRSLPTISILSVCGPRKTAKSFFCNMFLPRDAEEKFSTEETKGLWIYDAIVSDEKGEKKYLIVDTTSIDSSAYNVHKLITLVWLISSVVVFKDYRNLDITKFDMFRSVRNTLKTMSIEHEAPALAALIDDDLKIPDPDKYINDFVKNKQHPQISEAVSKCFPYRKIFQLGVPKPHELEKKDYHSGNFYTSFLRVKEELEDLLLDFSITPGASEASGKEFGKFFLDCVTKLNNTT